MKKLKLIGAITYTCSKMVPETISKGEVGTFEDDAIAAKVLENTYVDRRDEEVPYFEDVTDTPSDDTDSGEGSQAPKAVTPAAKRSRAS